MNIYCLQIRGKLLPVVTTRFQGHQVVRHRDAPPPLTPPTPTLPEGVGIRFGLGWPGVRVVVGRCEGSLAGGVWYWWLAGPLWLAWASRWSTFSPPSLLSCPFFCNGATDAESLAPRAAVETRSCWSLALVSCSRGRKNDLPAKASFLYA